MKLNRRNAFEISLLDRIGAPFFAAPAVAPFVARDRIVVEISALFVGFSAMGFIRLYWWRPSRRLLAYVAYCVLVAAAFGLAGVQAYDVVFVFALWMFSFGMYWVLFRGERRRARERIDAEARH